MIEIARLQNALVHSVSLPSYNKLLTDFKRLLHTQTVGRLKGVDGPDDHGYESEVRFNIDLISNTQF
jgi:hypothetical protein